MDEHVEALKVYIHQQLQAGLTIEQVVTQLQTAQWPNNYISRAFQSLHADPAHVAALPHEPVQQEAIQNQKRSKKASLNPFTHLVRGMKNLFASNPTASWLVIVVTAIINIAISYVLVAALFGSFIFVAFSLGVGGNALWNVMGIALLIAALYLPLMTYVLLITNRLVYEGVQKKRMAMADVFRVSFRGYFLALRTFLVIAGIYIVAFFIVLAVSHVVPVLAIIFTVIGIVMTLVVALRLSFISIVLVEDNAPRTVRGVLRRSSAVWQQSPGAVVLYILMLLAAYVALNFVGNIQLRTTGFLFIGHGLLSILPVIILPSVVATLLQVVSTAGLADIYTEVSKPQLPAESSS